MTALPDETDASAPEHILRELGFSVEPVRDELHGAAVVVPELLAPGTDGLRTSVLATWVDTVCGRLAVDVLAPRVPTTLELEVHVVAHPPVGGSVLAVGRVVKAGRSVVVAAVDLLDGRGDVVGIGTASFMGAADPSLRMPPLPRRLDAAPPERRIRVPLAERAGCVRTEPGTAVLPRSDDGLNSSNTVNGGLLALVVEEALLSLVPGRTLASLAMRYLRPVHVGPAVARAALHDRVARIEVCDAANDDRLAVLATATLAS